MSLFQTPGSAVSDGAYIYTNPISGEEVKIKSIFGWLYFRTPIILGLILVGAVALLIISLVSEWKHEKSVDYDSKTRATGEVMVSQADANKRMKEKVDHYDTDTLKAKRTQLKDLRAKYKDYLSQNESTLRRLAKWKKMPMVYRNLELASLNHDIAMNGLTMNEDSNGTFDTDNVQEKLEAEQQRLKDVIQDYSHQINALPPIYVAVKPPFYGYNS